MAVDEYGLTYKQRLFCMYYIKGALNKEGKLVKHNGTYSAIAAGYNESCAHSTATEILQYPKVKEHLRRLMKEEEQNVKEAALKLGITPELLLTKLLNNVEACETGKASQHGVVHPAGVVSSINEINKMVGNHEPEKTDSTHRVEHLKEILDEVKKEY